MNHHLILILAVSIFLFSSCKDEDECSNVECQQEQIISFSAFYVNNSFDKSLISIKQLDSTFSADVNELDIFNVVVDKDKGEEIKIFYDDSLVYHVTYLSAEVEEECCSTYSVENLSINGDLKCEQCPSHFYFISF